MRESTLQGRSWKPLLVLLMLVIGLAVTAGAALAAFPANKVAQAPAAPNSPDAILYDQYDNLSGSFVSFADGTSNNNSQAADDFVVPGGQTWTVTEVDVNGGPVLGGLQEPASFNVFFYNDSSTLPGTAVYSYTGLSYLGTTPAYTITVPSSVFAPGTYWVSVQADTSVAHDRWTWTGRSVTANNGSAWRNPGNGFSTGCTNWGRKTTCLGGDPDQAFRLQGTNVVLATATPTNTDTATPTPTATHIAQPSLYCQMDNASGVILSFNNGTTASSDAADDFVVPGGQNWSITQIDAPGGAISGSAPEPGSFTIIFYSDSSTLPGTALYTYTGLSYVLDTSTTVYTIDIPATLLGPGTYWLEVQANTTAAGNRWYWTGRGTQSNSGAAWRNPGGAFSQSGCTANWGRRGTTNCQSATSSTPDQAFCVRGNAVTNTDTPTSTSVPPTDTPTNTATNTGVPSTDTPTDTATGTPAPSTNTPTDTATGTPAAPTDTPTNTVTGTPPTSTNTATRTSTSTSIPATNTSAPATNTSVASATKTSVAGATSTPTLVCTSNFPDNQPGDTFYSYIQCLVCRGVVSGFPDGMFHAGWNITRGQISKVVSNAAGFNEDPGSQIYSDVPPGSPFYAYINRLTKRGIVSGYPCPTKPGEAAPGDTPCTPENPSLFRPNFNATRGQLAKIVSNAAGYNEAVSGQHYADVPASGTGSEFYTWIMRLTNRGVMSGYQCGTSPSEPCDAPNRPYFRPGTEVTRGQASKIVANTFFPNCQLPNHK